MSRLAAFMQVSSNNILDTGTKVPNACEAGIAESWSHNMLDTCVDPIYTQAHDTLPSLVETTLCPSAL